MFIWESVYLLSWKYFVTICLLSAKLRNIYSQFYSCIIHTFLNWERPSLTMNNQRRKQASKLRRYQWFVWYKFGTFLFSCQAIIFNVEKKKIPPLSSFDNQTRDYLENQIFLSGFEQSHCPGVDVAWDSELIKPEYLLLLGLLSIWTENQSQGARTTSYRNCSE